MKISRLQIMGKFLLAVAGAWALITVLLLVWFLEGYTEDLFGKGLPFLFLLKTISAASVPKMISAFPLAVAYGGIRIGADLRVRLKESQETNSRKKLLSEISPFVGASAVFFLPALLLSYSTTPKANLVLFSHVYEAAQVLPSVKLTENSFIQMEPGWELHMGEFDAQTSEAKRIRLMEPTILGSDEVEVTAQTGKVFFLAKNQLRLELENATRHIQLAPPTKRVDRHKYIREHFETINLTVRLEGMQLESINPTLFAEHAIMKSFSELSQGPGMDRDQAREIAEFMRAYLVIDSSMLTLTPSAQRIQTPILTSFPESDRLKIVNKAMSNSRSIKNYYAFQLNREEGKEIEAKKYKEELVKRINFPLAIFPMVLLGLVLGILIPWERMLGIALVTGSLGVIYFTLYAKGTIFVVFSSMPIGISLALPHLLILVLAIAGAEARKK